MLGLHPAMMTTSASEPRLAHRLRRRIAEGGPISFADFVESALYDPEEGFYSRQPVGEGGDFVTSPHISPVFGSLVARQIEEFWELLDRPAPFTVIEAGAGSGVLARQILEALPAPVRDVSRYIAVERSEAARKAAASRGIEAVATLSDLPGGQVGCVIANELLDNLPFHRIRRTDEGVVELFVGVDGEQFGLVEGPASEEVARVAPPLGPGQEGVVSLEALRFLDQTAALLDRGYLWLVDYGWPAPHSALVHGYRGHRVEENVLSEPGTADITAGVDFDALARHATQLGLEVWGPVTQRDALLALGFREWEEDARSSQTASLSEQRGLDAVRVFSERNRARLLVDPAGPGGFYVICFGVRTNRRPRSMKV
jgi:SAM-dependent MidA family methyltransferase